MALKKKRKYWYGTQQADIRLEIARYSANNYLATHFADARCTACECILFLLYYDGNEGCAQRTCNSCGNEHFIGDSEDYLDDAEPSQAVCVCGSKVFEITAGVALYEGSEDVRWLYLGCRCPTCGVTGVYADWKNEFNDYTAFLSRI